MQNYGFLPIQPSISTQKNKRKIQLLIRTFFLFLEFHICLLFTASL